MRVSMVLRGVPPTAAEVAAVRRDPSALRDLAEGWAGGPAFVETVKDWHAEMLGLRHDTQPMLPARGALQGVDLGRIGEAMAEAPLELVAERVRRGRPYTEIFSSLDVAADSITSVVWGLPYQVDGPHWQVAQWSDGRPAAGILVDSNLWARHLSSDTNHQRARANLVHNVWLCEDLSARTLDLSGIDLADVGAVSNAVQNNPGCTGCHVTLDPLAASFVDWRRYILQTEVREAYDAGCVDPDFCYPLKLWAPGKVATASELGLPAAALAGKPVADLAGLGQAVIDDPRFAPCVARQWLSYAGQEPRERVPDAEVDRLAALFVASGYDLRALAVASVLSPRFSANHGELGPLLARPEQVARTVAQRTGFVWRADPDEGLCEGSGCWGTVDLARSARWGFREVAGGMDGYDSLHPVHHPQPLRHLAEGRLAEEAGAWVVAQEAAMLPGERRLLREIELSNADSKAVSAQIAALHGRLSTESADPVDVAITLGLWQGVHGASGSTERAWAAVIAAMLQAPELRLY